MKSTVRLELSFNRPEEMDADAYSLKRVPLEITCVFGKPTCDPESTVEIPLMVKEIVVDGRVLGWEQREFILGCLGGEEGLCQLIKA